MLQLYQTTHFDFPPFKQKRLRGEKPRYLYYIYLVKLVILSSSLLIAWLLLSLYAIFLGCYSLEFLTLFMCPLAQHSS